MDRLEEGKEEGHEEEGGEGLRVGRPRETERSVEGRARKDKE